MAQTTVEPGPAAQTRPGSGVLGLVGAGAAVAALVAAGLTVLVNEPLVAIPGLPDPGLSVDAGLPAVRALAEVAMVLAIGAMLLAAFLVPPQRSGYLDVAGYRGVRAASAASIAWAAAAALMVPLSVADAAGRPLAEVLDVGLLVQAVPRLTTATAWTLTTLVALLVLVGSRTVLSWGWTAVVFGVSLLGPLPVALTGHSATGGSHDVASDSLVLHVLAASVWVGGLVAVLALAAARGPDRAAALATAVPRYSRTALVCWLVVGATGIVNALVRVAPADLVTTRYGALVVAKAAALVVLGGFGLAHRRRTVGPAAAGEAGALVRLGAVEAMVMLATVGLAVALGRSAPPATGSAPPSRTEVLIGYDLTAPPTALRLALDWRFNLIFGTAAIVLALLYLAALRRLRVRGDRWPVGRTVAWLCGCAALLIGTSSGIGRYGPAMFSVHMAEHMILSMLVPILMVLGAPVTLALRALPVAGRARPPGPREWLLAALHSPVARWLTHPLVTLPLFVGSYYALYFSGLFAAALPEHGAHVVMNLHFLVTGLLFFWPLIGLDPAPRRLPPAARLGILFVSVPFHAFFGVAVMSSETPIAGDFYRALALPWVPDPLRDQQLGGGLAWASGEIPLLLVVIAMLVQWARQDERSARRDDRRADADGDAELAAYNAMLRQLAAGGRPSGAGGEVRVASRDAATGETDENTPREEPSVGPP
jgi:cytochrome c oxidase assembly factor CtaG/putative copper export protein